MSTSIGYDRFAIPARDCSARNRNGKGTALVIQVRLSARAAYPVSREGTGFPRAAAATRGNEGLVRR